MERLTKRDIDGCLIHPWSFNGINGSYDIWDEDLLEKQIDRLAAYEDTGLEPEDIISAVDMGKIACALHELNAYKDLGQIDHIRDLIQAEQDSRLVVLPCKVVCGTTIWWADSSIHADPIKCEISSFGIYTGPDGELQLWMNCYVYGTTPTSRSFRMSSIGKTVFLTRKEAEAVLAGKG